MPIPALLAGLGAAVRMAGMMVRAGAGRAIAGAGRRVIAGGNVLEGVKGTGNAREITARLAAMRGKAPSVLSPERKGVVRDVLRGQHRFGFSTPTSKPVIPPVVPRPGPPRPGVGERLAGLFRRRPSGTPKPTPPKSPSLTPSRRGASGVGEQLSNLFRRRTPGDPKQRGGMIGELLRTLRGSDRGKPIVRPNLTRMEIARRLGTPNPTTAQVEQVRSEDEARHQQELARNLKENSGGLKRVVFGMLSLGVAMPFLGDGIKRLAGRVLINSDELRALSPTIATAFARMERQTAFLNVRQARGTAGTTRRLSAAYMRLRETSQPLKQAGTNMLNMLMLAGTNVVNMLLSGWYNLPGIKQAVDFMASMGEDEKTGQQADFLYHLSTIAKGQWGPITGDPNEQKGPFGPPRVPLRRPMR